MYKSEYLKYKSKYLELKNLYGGFINTHEYNLTIPEFKNQTRAEYKSVVPRNFNTIAINGVDGRNIDYKETALNFKMNIESMDKTVPYFEDFISLLNSNSEDIIEIKAFHNKYEDYIKNKDNGTYVKKENIDEVFEDKTGLNGRIIKVFNSNDDIFYPIKKGLGKIHLNEIMKRYKKQNPNIKFVFLEAAGTGDSKLVQLYNKYGFFTLCKGCYSYMEIDERIERLESSNTLMFGHIDDIIRNTESTD